MTVDRRINAEELLSSLEISDSQQTECTMLLQSACKSMAILETWNHATSDHPVAMDIIERVKAQIGTFCEALDDTRQVAKRGCKLSQDMSNFCDFLLEDNNSQEEIEDFINEMRTISKKASKDAHLASKLFRTVRYELNEISNNIPEEVTALEEEKQGAQKKIAQAKRRGERAKIVRACSTAVAAVAGGVALITCPPALILLPIVLPLFALIAEGYEMQNQKKIHAREKQAHDCEEALRTLHSATTDLVALTRCTDAFAEYWIRMDTLLGIVGGRVHELKGAKHLKLRLKTIKASWNELSKGYIDYSTKMKQVQAFIPSPSPSISSGGHGSHKTAPNDQKRGVTTGGDPQHRKRLKDGGVSHTSASRSGSVSPTPSQRTKASGFLTLKRSSTTKQSGG